MNTNTFDNTQKPGIIIFQSTGGGQAICSHVAQQMNLTPDIDYVFVDRLGDAGKYLDPGARQLLITGSLLSDTNGIAPVVSKLRNENKELVVMSFSSIDIPGPFDARLEKNADAFLNLANAIAAFQHGLLNRKS